GSLSARASRPSGAPWRARLCSAWRFGSPLLARCVAFGWRNHMHQQPSVAPLVPNRASRSGQVFSVSGSILSVPTGFGWVTAVFGCPAMAFGCPVGVFGCLVEDFGCGAADFGWGDADFGW